MQKIFFKITGGVNGKDFTQLFNEESDPDEIDLLYHSP